MKKFGEEDRKRRQTKVKKGQKWAKVIFTPWTFKALLIGGKFFAKIASIYFYFERHFGE